MGAWGYGFFENDCALDWVGELEETNDYSAIYEALNTIEENSDGEPEADDCSYALAAAEVVACIHTQQTSSLPDDLSEWLESRGELNPELLTKAKKATQAILANSELKDLWEGSEEWQSEVENLLSRLG